MPESPLVTVVIPTYNRAEALVGSVRSVLDGTHENVEVIVVDDAGTDDTEARVRELMAADPRVRYHRQPSNMHANVARNTGFELSRGAYLSFLDSDDLFRKDKIERQLAALDAHPESGACVCQIQLFKETPGDTDLAWNRLHGEHPMLRYAANDVVWGTAAPLWRREALERVGPWDVSLKFHQDLDYHLRALSLGVGFVLIPDVLEDYHDASGGTITAGARQRPDNIARLMDVYENAERIARDRGVLDEVLCARFAATYFWCAVVGARMGEREAGRRARRAGLRVDPNGFRRALVGLFLVPTLPVLTTIRTGAKPLVDNQGLIGLPYHRWKYGYTLRDVEGKVYEGTRGYGDTPEVPSP